MSLWDFIDVKTLRSLAQPSLGYRSPASKELTQREGDVLRLMSQGQSNKQIARSLGIFDGTVKLHAKAIFRKLGVSRRAEAVARMSGAG